MATPYMGLVLPTVSVTPGPTYATENNTAFTTIDSHDHTSGKGVPIATAAININADLDFNSYNAIGLRSAIFESQASALALGTDIGSIYNLSGNPTWNDNSGTATRIVNSSYPMVVGDLLYASTTTTWARLGIGTSGQALKVSGGIPSWQTSANSFTVTTETGASFTADVAVDVYLCNPTTTQAISLPASTGSGHSFKFKKVSSGISVLTISRAGADVIVDSSGNVTSTTLNTTGEEIEIVDVSSGVWQILNRRIPAIWNSSLTFTPDATAFGTITGSQFFSRRSGDSLDVRGYWACGTTDASQAFISLPSGIVVDAAKMQTIASGTFGVAAVFPNSSTSFGRFSCYFEPTQTGRIYITGTGASYIYQAINGNTLASSSQGIAVQFTFPVSGWNG
jgi:hypothetical protein